MKTQHVCDFCGEKFEVSEGCLEHESECTYNPNNKTCMTCGFADSIGVPVINGEIGDFIVGCSMFDKSLTERRGCTAHATPEEAKRLVRCSGRNSRGCRQWCMHRVPHVPAYDDLVDGLCTGECVCDAIERNVRCS